MSLFSTVIAAFYLAAAAQIQSAKTPSTPAPQAQSAKKAEAFKSFTGKVLANKVRIREKPDLDSHVVRQAGKNDLLLIVGETGDFWAVQPPSGTKAYVFRTYVLDNVVEANRVNVRLEPHADAPIIGQLQAGDRVKGEICAMNHKWLEIAPPVNAKFYVSKEFIAHAGGPDYLAAMEKRKTSAKELVSSASFLAQSECKKAYEEMSIHEAASQFQTVMSNYADFPEEVQQAKEGLAQLKETYLQKKIAYLEARAELSSSVKEELMARHAQEHKELFQEEVVKTDWKKRAPKADMSDRLRFWDTIEESLYLSWSAFHTDKHQDDFYQEQKANASVLSGKIESYEHPVKNKPGDYILRSRNAPIAYLYSTQVDLEEYEGKTVTILASPRPNNHFAFPAYFVLAVE